MSRYEGLESVKTDLVAAKGVIFCKFAKASQALVALEQVSETSMVSCRSCCHSCRRRPSRRCRCSTWL
jgi:hypothetical protein